MGLRRRRNEGRDDYGRPLTTEAPQPPSRSGGAVTSITDAPRSKDGTQRLLEATDLAAWNASMKGDSDVLPWLTEFRLLRGYTRELAEAVWAATDPVAVEEVVVPLSRETHRYAHLLGAPTYLRLFGPVLAVAERLEAVRVPSSIATAARYSPNRSRGRIVQAGAYDRWDEGLARITGAFPYVLRLDLATFFPSLTPEIIHAALAPFGRSVADLTIDELTRTGIRGLPVGGVPARLIAEAILHPLDSALQRLGRQHVRALDDMAIGVTSHEDAEALIVQVAEIVRPLELNKSKTKILPAAPAHKIPGDDASEVARHLLAQLSPDRVLLACTLGRLRREIPRWERMKRQRWICLLVDAVVRLRVCVPQILRFIETLMPGTDGPQWENLSCLLDSPEPLIRASAARFLSRNGRDVRAQLTRLVVADKFALVRREAIFGLVRLDAKAEVAGLLRGTPITELDRSAWIVAAGVFGLALPFALGTPYQRLLFRAAREHSAREV